jgi:glyoxylase-like metal-dependent hydrolase (beta-lactamase superfamily II)
MTAVREERRGARGPVEEVAPGVLRAQLPITMPGLGHVNCYILPDGDGCAVVDPGMPGTDNYTAMVKKLAEAGYEPRHVHSIFVTHSHPDHFGAVGRLAERSEAKVVTHSAFRLLWREDPNDPCEQIHDVDPEDLPEGNPFANDRTPWGGKPHERPRTLQLEESEFTPPTPTHRLKDGDRITLGGREWWAVHTPGHTLDHLCLFEPEHGTFLSGDHVLPTITPHISGIGAGRDPLGMFKASLDKVAALPGVTKVLPAHGLELDDLKARVDAIHEHHVERLERVRQIGLALGEADVIAFSHELFREQVWGPAAESETFAHLEHLRLAGEAERRDVDGLLRYRVLV